MIARILAGAALAVATLTLGPTANADTENCATHGEVDQLETLMSPMQVHAIVDADPRDLGNASDGDEFKLGYRSCWAPGEERLVCFYSYYGYGLTRWAIRDV